MSPDSKKVLLTSDQGVAYLYTINQDGFYTDKCEYKGMRALSICMTEKNSQYFLVSEEPSLSCAWNQSSEMFAVTSQDGFVSIYNIHSATRLCHLGSAEVNCCISQKQITCSNTFFFLCKTDSQDEKSAKKHSIQHWPIGSTSLRRPCKPCLYR